MLGYEVTTQSGSVYLLDMGAGTLARCLAGAGPLRRDGEAIAIVAMAPTKPVVGLPMAFLLNLREDGILTARVTSPVTAATETEG